MSLRANPSPRLPSTGLWACTRVLAGLSLGWLVGCGDGASGPGRDVPLAFSTGAIRVDVQSDPFRLQLRSRSADGPGLLTRGTESGSIRYRRGGTSHELIRVVDHRSEAGELVVSVATDEGEPATVTLRASAGKALEITIEPPRPESLTAIGTRWDSPGDEHVYGLTERLRDSPLIQPGLIDVPREDIAPREVGSLDRRGERVEMFVRPTFAVYAPFYQSSRGYGVFVSGTMPGTYDVASSDPAVVSFEFETGTIAENRRLRLYVFAGSPPEILDQYTELTGRPIVPPEWAFLNWRWRGELAVGEPAELDGVSVNAEVAEDVSMYERFGIPPGVYLLDRPVLEGQYGFGRFVWDEERLPNVRAMLERLRARGYRLVTWSSMWACGDGPADNGRFAQESGFLAPGATGAPVLCADVGGHDFILDPTHPDAYAWWRDELAAFLREERIDGVKLDRGEEHIPSEVTDVWADGRNGREVHNDYVVLQTRLHNEALRSAHPDGDFVLFTRAAWAGVQRDAVVWGGDIPGSEQFGTGPGTDLGLRSAIISQLRAAEMGFPIWGSDTGGYYEFKDREVFARWLEFSAFSGLMEIGGTGAHAPWDMPTEPSFDEEMIEIYRRYVQLRHDMIDYVTRVAAEAATGMPMARPMRYLDPSDPALADLWDQYLFGPDLLVAPVWRIGQRSRSVYLPAGTWRSLWDESRTWTGPQTIEVDVPLTEIPVFIRGEAASPVVGAPAARSE